MIIGMERAVNGNLKPKQATFHIWTSFWMKTQKTTYPFESLSSWPIYWEKQRRRQWQPHKLNGIFIVVAAVLSSLNIINGLVGSWKCFGTAKDSSRNRYLCLSASSKGKQRAFQMIYHIVCYAYGGMVMCMRRPLFNIHVIKVPEILNMLIFHENVNKFRATFRFVTSVAE